MASEETGRALDLQDTLESIDVLIGNTGANEHSPITQGDHAITPGGADPYQHLIGTCVIAPEIAPDVAFLLADSYANGEVEIDELHLKEMSFGGKLAIATMQVSNSIGGRNQDVKAKMIGGGQAPRKTSRWSRRGRGYEGGGENE